MVYQILDAQKESLLQLQDRIDPQQNLNWSRRRRLAEFHDIKVSGGPLDFYFCNLNSATCSHGEMGARVCIDEIDLSKRTPSIDINELRIVLSRFIRVVILTPKRGQSHGIYGLSPARSGAIPRLTFGIHRRFDSLRAMHKFMRAGPTRCFDNWGH